MNLTVCYFHNSNARVPILQKTESNYTKLNVASNYEALEPSNDAANSPSYYEKLQQRKSPSAILSNKSYPRPGSADSHYSALDEPVKTPRRLPQQSASIYEDLIDGDGKSSPSSATGRDGSRSLSSVSHSRHSNFSGSQRESMMRVLF